LKITFLGTGTSQGIPMINSRHPVCLSDDKRDKRLRSSLLIEWDQFTYVIDCGPDFRYQMLRANVAQINGVLFTHEHADHTAGLDDLRVYSFQLGAVPIYAQKRVLDDLSDRFKYIFREEDKYPGTPTLQKNIVGTEDFILGNQVFTPIEVLHGNLKVLGYKFHNIAYITDVKSIPEEEKAKVKGIDVLILGTLRERPHRSHLNLHTSVIIWASMPKWKRTYRKMCFWPMMA
jgi:phosphoribosyl 1,2-cyclic phosphate phosphodiesterase